MPIGLFLLTCINPRDFEAKLIYSLSALAVAHPKPIASKN